MVYHMKKIFVIEIVSSFLKLKTNLSSHGVNPKVNRKSMLLN